MIDRVELSQTLALKLCHDLVGSIGAVESGAGLVDSTDKVIQEKAVGLVKYGSEELISRLKLYRYAYGASYSDEAGTVEEIHSLIKSVLALSKGKISLTFKSTVDTISPIVGKTLACMFVTTFTTFKVGELNIDITKKQITFMVKGKQFRLHTKKYDILKGDLATNPLNAYNIHEHYLYYLSQKANCTFVIDQSEYLSTFKIILQD